MEQIELIATSAFGLEAIVEREVQKLGFTDTKVEDGRVRFKGDLTAICKANLWLRCADRVLLVIGEFHCPDFEALFERTKEMPWENWLAVDAKFPVYAKSVKSMLTATPTVQKAVKKAIVERLKTKHQRVWFEETGAEYPIEVSLLNDRATLTIDTSGEGLHKRGYRQETTDAPLKETLAAALVQLSYWNRDRILVDPCCGSGTIPIEAALIARNMPPGGDRSFAAELWPQVSMKLWTEARKEARDLRQKPLEQAILASDMDPQVIRLARKHASDAGVGMDIHFERKLVNEFSEYREYGCMIVNPPYGERMGDRDSVDQMCVDFGEIMRLHPTWSFYFLTAHPVFERLTGRPADRRRKLFNGRIECTYFQYQGPRPPREAEAAAAELLASIPEPPVDFRPLKSPIRGPAAGRPLDQFVTITPLEEGPDQGDGYDYSNRPVPRPPLDFKPLKPPLRGPLAATVETSTDANPATGEALEQVSAEVMPASVNTDEHSVAEPVAVEVLDIGTAYEAVATTEHDVPAGLPAAVDSSPPEQLPAQVETPAPVRAPEPAPQPVYEIPPALIYRMRNLEFLPMKPPLRGPFAPNWDPSALIGAAPSPTSVVVSPAAIVTPPVTTRVVPPPPPGFKPLKPPTRVATPSAVPAEEPAPAVAAPISATVEDSQQPMHAPIPVPPPPTRPMSLAELAAQASRPPVETVPEPPPASAHSEVVVDW